MEAREDDIKEDDKREENMLNPDQVRFFFLIWRKKTFQIVVFLLKFHHFFGLIIK